MSNIKDASLTVENNGRTFDAVSNPRKYKSFIGISNKQDFEKEWKSNPGWIFANFSHIAYYDPEHIQSCLEKFNFKATFYDDGKGRQAFLAVDSDKAILCFRGTEPSDVKDLLDDVKIFNPTSYKSATVHRGFLDATLSLMENKGEGIASELKKLSNHKLYVTGHSLGAAMAVIAGMSNKFDKVVTFGEPRVGGNINLLGDNGHENHIRFVNGKDIVTTAIPETSSYIHYGIEKLIPVVEDHEFFVGNLFDHSIINYADRIKMIHPGFILD